MAAAGMRKASEFPLLRLMYRNSSTDEGRSFPGKLLPVRTD
jgi:hypothetical protein